MQPIFDEVKDSANRMKMQIYLQFSEMQPIFDNIKDTKKFWIIEINFLILHS